MTLEKLNLEREPDPDKRRRDRETKRFEKLRAEIGRENIYSRKRDESEPYREHAMKLLASKIQNE